MCNIIWTRTFRRSLAAVPVGAVAAALWAGPALAAPEAGSCRVSLPVTVAAPDRGHPAARTFRSDTGSASCIGSLGPWLMGGRTGWSTVRGTLRALPGDAAYPGSVGADGQLWAEVPRFAWFHPSMVDLTADFRLRPSGGALRLDGAGRLLVTPKSPAACSFEIAGVGQLTRLPRHRGTEMLTLEFSVRSNPTATCTAG